MELTVNVKALPTVAMALAALVTVGTAKVEHSPAGELVAPPLAVHRSAVDDVFVPVEASAQSLVPLPDTALLTNDPPVAAWMAMPSRLEPVTALRVTEKSVPATTSIPSW